MRKDEIVEYYTRDDIIEKIVTNAKNREIAGAFLNGAYDKRPNSIQFKSDLNQMIKKNIVSIHYSVEHWRNPMAITKNQDVYNELRTGWDLLIDIDSKIDIEESQITAQMISEFLKKNGIKNHGIKFSGRRGFHIILPWIMFPKEINYKNTILQYPRLPKIISSFIREKISDNLMKVLMKRKKVKEMAEDVENVTPYYFVEVEKNWGNRHMFRAPYSLNEKTWLASIPIDNDRIEKFSISEANPKNDFKDIEFFKGEESEAENLLTSALDWYSEIEKDEPVKKVKINPYEKKIHEKNFPPCMKLILSGLNDGKKRSLFILTNFLRLCNWKWPEIEARLNEWNKLNKTPLPVNIINYQIRQAQQNQTLIANCSNEMYYQDIGICNPDSICKKKTDKIMIKNPISYPLLKIGKEGIYKKIRGFSCGVCNKEFEKRTALSIHRSKIHNLED